MRKNCVNKEIHQWRNRLRNTIRVYDPAIPCRWGFGNVHSPDRAIIVVDDSVAIASDADFFSELAAAMR
jgi:hypothetical protein